MLPQVGVIQQEASKHALKNLLAIVETAVLARRPGYKPLFDWMCLDAPPSLAPRLIMHDHVGYSFLLP